MKKIFCAMVLAGVFAACNNEGSAGGAMKDSAMEKIDSAKGARIDSIEETTDSVKQRLERTIEKTDSANAVTSDSAVTQ